MRGFTGHEHLDDFGLINMNARMYDPALGRFLSMDPYVQMPDNTQNYNRYSYALNNPLTYTDPTGEFFITPILGPLGAMIDAACWGALAGGTAYVANIAFSNGGFNNWNWGQFGKLVGSGTLSGITTTKIGQLFGPVGNMGVGGELMRAYTHGLAQGMVSELTGGNFRSGFASTGLSSLTGSMFMMYGGKFANSTIGTYTFSGLGGGIGSELTSGDFWQGAATGLINAGLNHFQTISYAGARYYTNTKTAYRAMWNTSFEKGIAKREVSGWELENGGVIILPYKNNTVSESYNDALKLVKLDDKHHVLFNGKILSYKNTHVHTHPKVQDGIGLSSSDIKCLIF